MQGLEAWQDQVARNLSASSVPGYQRQHTVFESFLANELNPLSVDSPKGPARMIHSLQHTVFEQGHVRKTGAELDFSAKPGAFFKLQLPDGRPFFTRDGHFQLNGEGTLINSRGLEVQVDGTPLTIDPALGPVVANKDGTLSQNGAEIGRLDISTFDSPQALMPIFGGFIEPEPGMAGEQQVEEPGILQGTVEGSNVSPIEEMSNLITLSRAYETHHKLIQSEDENMKKALQYLNPSSGG